APLFRVLPADAVVFAYGQDATRAAAPHVMGRAMKVIRRFALLLALVPLIAFASETELKLDRAPIDSLDTASLQRGARTFVNYCLNCHSANYMRYNRLQDIGLSEAQIRDNLVLTGAKVGELMKVAMDPKASKEWFGTTPPDLSVIARSRASHAGTGADWLYTYLRSFYRDPSRPTGWNNTIFPNVGMPHVLWQLQGEQALKTEVRTIPLGTKGEVKKFEEPKLEIIRPGSLKPAE